MNQPFKVLFVLSLFVLCGFSSRTEKQMSFAFELPTELEYNLSIGFELPNGLLFVVNDLKINQTRAVDSGCDSTDYSVVFSKYPYLSFYSAISKKDEIIYEETQSASLDEVKSISFQRITLKLNSISIDADTSISKRFIRIVTTIFLDSQREDGQIRCEMSRIPDRSLQKRVLESLIPLTTTKVSTITTTSSALPTTSTSSILPTVDVTSVVTPVEAALSNVISSIIPTQPLISTDSIIPTTLPDITNVVSSLNNDVTNIVSSLNDVVSSLSEIIPTNTILPTESPITIPDVSDVISSLSNALPTEIIPTTIVPGTTTTDNTNNNSTNNNTTIIGIITVCPSNAPFNCLGRCVATIGECITLSTCPSINTPFLCTLDKLCYKDVSSCILNNNNNTNNVCNNNNKLVCWDGSCADSLLNCKPIPSCPSNYRRCPEGCVPATQQCMKSLVCTPGEYPCPSAVCSTKQICPEFNGCPINELLCAESGRCVTSYDQCLCSMNGTYLCANGQCSSSCNMPLESILLPMDVTFSPSIDQTVSLIGYDQSILGKVTFPSNSVEVSENITEISLRINQVPSSLLNRIDSNYKATIVSTAINVKVAADEEVSQQFQKPVSLSFIINDLTIDISKLYLAYINSSGEWEKVSDLQEGTPFQVGQRVVVGQTTHFSSFAVLLGESQSTDTTVENIINPGSKDKKVPTGVIIGVIVGAVALVIAGAAAAFFLKAKQNKEEQNDMTLCRESLESA